jgi:YVTN family beta-propeller protein
VIATATNTVVATIPVWTTPYGIAATPDGTKVYVVNHGSNTVSVIDTATNTVAGSPIPVGSRPALVGIGPPPPPAPVAACDAAKQRTCESLVQNQILWNLADTRNPVSKHWTGKDLADLCGCTVYPPDTVNCFQNLLYNDGHPRTQAQAIALCRAKPGGPGVPDMGKLAGEQACNRYLLNRNVPTPSGTVRIMAPILDGLRLELCQGAADDAAAAMRVWRLAASFTQKLSPALAAYNCSHGQGPIFPGSRAGPRRPGLRRSRLHGRSRAAPARLPLQRRLPGQSQPLRSRSRRPRRLAFSRQFALKRCGKNGSASSRAAKGRCSKNKRNVTRSCYS